MKRGQMKLSFGMIFSIILVVIFIIFAFFAIQKFLEIPRAVQIAKFSEDLQQDVDKIWKGSQGLQKIAYNLPSKIEKVCFVDYSKGAVGEDSSLYRPLKQVFWESENMIFSPVGSAEGSDSTEIKHLDIDKTTNLNNPLCFENKKGKVSLIIKMDYGESQVTLVKE